jgi:ABC-type lipopolysaccharide export system ATPase subunit
MQVIQQKSAVFEQINVDENQKIIFQLKKVTAKPPSLN